MKARSADGVSIHYEVAGSGDPTLVFVHGWCCDKSYWDPQMKHFAKRHRVVTIDLAGHGESGLDRKDWTAAAFGEDAATVVNQLSIEKMILIGHSMGGPVIVEAAKRLPGRVIGLVGVDTFQDIDRKMIRVPVEDRLAQFRKDFVGTSQEIVRSMFVDSSDPELRDRILADMSSSPPSVGIGAMEAMMNHNVAQAIEDVKVPIRCVCSDYRPFDLEAAKQHAPSFEVEFMSGVGHFVMLEDEKTFNRLLEEIIEEFGGGTGSRLEQRGEE